MSRVTFKEPVSYIPQFLHPTTVDLSGVSSSETSDKETEDELIRHYQPQVKSFEGGVRPKTVLHVSITKQEKSMVAHHLPAASCRRI